MPAQPLYKDLSKRTNDLLTKDYPTDTKVEYTNYKTNNGGNLDANATVRKDGTVTTVFTPKWKFLVNEQPVQALLELTSKKDVKAEFTVEPTAVKDLKVVATVVAKDAEVDVVESLNVEYRHESVTTNVNLDFKAKGVAAKTTVVVGAKAFSLGALAEYFFDKSGNLTPQEFAATATYRHPNNSLDVSLFGKQNHRGASVKSEVGVNFFQNVNRQLALGGNVAFDTNAPNDRPKAEFAALFKPDSTVQFKAKSDLNGRVTVGVQQTLSSRAKLSLSSSTDTSTFSNFPGKGASNVGLLLTLSD